MIKTSEYEGSVQWAKDAPLATLVDAITENRRYPSVIRDELRARLKPTPGLTVTDLLWSEFMKCVNVHPIEQKATTDAPGAFLVELRENKDFWRWAMQKGAFLKGAETMWKKCFDPKLTDSPEEALTSGELGLIMAFHNALRDYKTEEEHDFQAFLGEGDE